MNCNLIEVSLRFIVGVFCKKSKQRVKFQSKNNKSKKKNSKREKKENLRDKETSFIQGNTLTIHIIFWIP